ncbi:MAG TPA: 4-alpha-glucanotransferase [Xanthobacteraceae bacterium]|nr:4-alpha-glucanotransferase [Xanthobacteraceae bacterium]
MGRPQSWSISHQYFDAFGRSHEVAPHDVTSISHRLIADGQGHAEVFVARADGVRALAVPSTDRPWVLVSEGNAQPIAAGEGVIHLPPDLPSGSYCVAADGLRYPLLVAPRAAYQPDFVKAGRRLWVIAVQLYAVRSRRNWGHGDFTDLMGLLDLAARSGAAGVGVNPLHALPPGQASPYSPSSRLFLNPLYIALDAVPEFHADDLPGLANELAALRRADLVDYPRITALKEQALRLAYRRFRAQADDGRRAAFARFREARGDALARYAAFETLRARHGSPWWEWPVDLSTPSPALLAQLRAASDEMEFHEYVQWLADEQLAACNDHARALGLPVGLYLDLAVGVALDGADAWAEQDKLARDLVIGAPPDAWNPGGQNWGIASFHPQALIETDFVLFRQTLRAVMRHAGAIRIDHALGLNRVFLIPRELDATHGAYVQLPFEAMLAVVAQESHRARCLVIGEDLGTVPEGVSETLRDWGVWSYRVALFERHGDGAFRGPHDYSADAIVTFTTHDLPTFAGWMSERDLKLKREIGMDPGEAAHDRGQAIEGLHRAVRHHGIHVPDALAFEHVARFLARTPCRLLAVLIEDILEIPDQINVPGTVSEYQNWMKRLPLALEELPAHQNIQSLAAALAAEGRSVG